MEYKYGKFSDSQFFQYQKKIQNSIFFLLLCADKKTKENFLNVDVNKAFENLQYRISGLNSILSYPPEVVHVVTLLEEARRIYNQTPFQFLVYKKLILDAGAEIMKIKEVQHADP